MCSSVMECGCTVILAEIIQNLRNTAVAGRFCENGFNIILMIAQKLGPQHHQLGVKESGAVSGVEHIFEYKDPPVWNGSARLLLHERSGNFPLFSDRAHGKKISQVRCQQQATERKYSEK